jgi:PAS domain S-box-containing protein
LERDFAQTGLTFSRDDLLRWIYVGRVVVTAGILVAAFGQWLYAEPQQTLVATIMFLVAVAASSASYWYTDILAREPGENLLYAQAVLDVLLTTGIVHITGGAASEFAPLYVLVIGAAALLLPLPGVVLIGGLGGILYVADILWFRPAEYSAAVVYQIGLFALVAFVTGFLGDRLRRAGIAVGAVESELRQLRLDTGEILAAVATGVLTVDGGGRLVYANPAAESLLGLEARRWLGAPVLGLVDDAAPGMGAVLRRSIEEGLPVPRFKTVRRGEGTEIVLGVSTAVLERADGGPPSATAIFQDVSDLERVEALNRRTARLEAVAALSASLAHEIKNPLASIRSAVEQLSRAHLSADDRGTLENLVLGESDRLSRLLSEFLEFSGLRKGASEPLDLSEVVRHCVTLARQHPEARENIEISCRGLDEPIVILGDADLLHRALFNLLLNALHFTESGQSVQVELVASSVSTPAEASDVERPVLLRVRDHGPGIAAEERGRIFDPFYTTRAGGSGLGLAVVHRAVQVHDGAVLVDDAPGGGCEFTIYLPGGAHAHRALPVGAV